MTPLPPNQGIAGSSPTGGLISFKFPFFNENWIVVKNDKKQS